MSKKQKIMRMMISGTLLAAVTLVGISVYQVDVSRQERMEDVNEPAKEEDVSKTEGEQLLQGGNSTADLDEIPPNHAVIENEEEELPITENVSSNDVTAQLESIPAEEEAQKKDEENLKNNENQEEKEEQVEVSSGNILPDVNFDGELMMIWPVEGEVLMDYSMDKSVYFSTLNEYKYNPSILLEAEIGTPVEASSNMKILNIDETLETGVTITADMGNGYQAVYGQLKDVTVSVDDVVAAGTVLGYVNEPTKYYTKEGANLYFAITKDGEHVDPLLYLP